MKTFEKKAIAYEMKHKMLTLMVHDLLESKVRVDPITPFV
jgi:hypothetical protein